jgi:tryptophan synthase alpha chain
MGYMNPFYHYGMEKFLQNAQEYNIQGTIIPDLPYEMAQNLNQLFDKYNKANITFVAPTDSEERIKLIVADAKKFIYMVAYAGITGSGQKEDLSQLLKCKKIFRYTFIYWFWC